MNRPFPLLLSELLSGDANRFEKPPFFFVFDVESIGLHGEAFAFGISVLDQEGVEHSSYLYACPPDLAAGSEEDRDWCRANIPEIQPNVKDPWNLRIEFLRLWFCWAKRGAVMAADCAWPVEARFLCDVFGAEPYLKFSGPYPLIDIGSVLMAKGINPTASFTRLPSELPEHNPLADARQSGRVLLNLLSIPRQPA